MSNSFKNKTVITGMGCVTPVGADVSATWEALCSGTSGIKEITLFETSTLRNQNGGEVSGFKGSEGSPRSLQFLVKAVDEALTDAGLNNSPGLLEPAGLSLGTNFGSCTSFTGYMKTGNPSSLDQYAFSFYTDRIVQQFGVQGVSAVISLACASGLGVIDAGMQILDQTDASIVVCAGVDELTLYSYAGLSSLRAITKDRIKPFTKTRAGTQFSEGAGVIILEEKEHAVSRGADILACIEGIFLNNDAFHTTAPDTEGLGITSVMERVFEQTDISRNDVGYINAHGTGTKYNDEIETKAIKNVFGEHAYDLCISSIKSMTGHEMGAAGIIELISTVMTLRTGIIPPTINFDEPDEACDLNYCVNEKVEKEVRYALTNSYGIGGANASLLVSAGNR
jgi:3-oxoacyl-[acyl-carrier-protein] synthase II